MKIQEVEELLGISQSNIRFYEKQDLLKPRRSDNKYRVYEDEDINRLKTIIILRKLGVSVSDIGKILNGTYPLQDAMQKNIEDLNNQIEVLHCSLKLSRSIVNDCSDTLDANRYWKMIHDEEAKGGRFNIIMSEYWAQILEPILRRDLRLPENVGIRQIVIRGLFVWGIYALMKTFFWKDGDLLNNFLHWPMVYSILAIILLPAFLLKEKHPKLASALINIIITICALILGGFLLLFLYGLIHYS